MSFTSNEQVFGLDAIVYCLFAFSINNQRTNLYMAIKYIQLLIRGSVVRLCSNRIKSHENVIRHFMFMTRFFFLSSSLFMPSFLFISFGALFDELELKRAWHALYSIQLNRQFTWIRITKPMTTELTFWIRNTHTHTHSPHYMHTHLIFTLIILSPLNFERIVWREEWKAKKGRNHNNNNK